MNSTVECAVDDFNAFVKLLILADRYSVVVAIPQPSNHKPLGISAAAP